MLTDTYLTDEDSAILRARFNEFAIEDMWVTDAADASAMRAREAFKENEWRWFGRIVLPADCVTLELATGQTIRTHQTQIHGEEP